jgi:hypothetical protein
MLLKNLTLILALLILTCGCSTTSSSNYDLYVDFELSYNFNEDATYTAINAKLYHIIGRILASNSDVNDIRDATLMYNDYVLAYDTTAYSHNGGYDTDSSFFFLECEEFKIDLEINNKHKYFDYGRTLDIKPVFNQPDSLLSGDTQILIDFKGQSTESFKTLSAKFYEGEELIYESEKNDNGNSLFISFDLPTVVLADRVELVLECYRSEDIEVSDLNITRTFNYQYFGEFQYNAN